jgi:hypothetical protein
MRTAAATFNCQPDTLNLPREVFFKLVGFIRQSITKSGTESVETVRTATLKALRDAGRAYDCEIKYRSPRADLYWCSKGKRLAAWQIHTDNLDKRWVRKVEGSKALLRFAVIVKASCYFKIVPRPTGGSKHDSELIGVPKRFFRNILHIYRRAKTPGVPYKAQEKPANPRSP